MIKKNNVLLWCLLLSLIVSLPAASSPTTPAIRMITADVGVEKGPLNQMFNLMCRCRPGQRGPAGRLAAAARLRAP